MLSLASTAGPMLSRSTSMVSSSSTSSSACTPNSDCIGSVLDYAAAVDDYKAYNIGKGGAISVGTRKRSRTGHAEVCSYGLDLVQQALKRPSSGQQRAQLAQLEATLRGYINMWSRKLTDLQPKCLVEPQLIDHAIAIFDSFSHVYMEQLNNSLSGGPKPPQLSWEALGAACFWISIKADGSRACLPSRALLERACNIPAQLLTALELNVLVVLEWDVFGLLRRDGFSCTRLPAGESQPCGFH